MVNQNEFECEICNRTFKAKITLLNHARSHRKGKYLITKPMKKSKAIKKENFNCEYCNVKFYSQSEFNSHKIFHVDAKNDVDARKKRNTWKKRKNIKTGFICTICNKTFATNFKLVRHGYTHMSVKPFPCDICGRRFSRKDHLQVHYRIHTGEKTCYCIECGQGFNSTTALHRHIDRLHSIDRKTVECPECGLEFAFKVQLKRHYDFVHKTYFTCEFCGNISYSEVALFRHIRKHVLTEPFVCLICSSTFNTTELMKEHQCYPSQEDPCKIVVRVALANLFDLDAEIDPIDQSLAQKLQRKFDNRGRRPKQRPHLCNLTNRMKNDMSFCDFEEYIQKSNCGHTCKFCEKGFYTEAEKLAHEAVHIDGYDTAICPICKMKFSTNSKLARHLRVHTGENPFPCKFCGKAFPRQDYLQRHMLNIHSTDKETCPFCYKFCPTPEELAQHLKSHQDNDVANSYFCDTCDSCFTQFCDFKSHMLDSHSTSCYRCKYCPKIFYNEKTKVKHQYNCQQLAELSDDDDDVFTIDESLSNFNNESESIKKIELHPCDMCDAKFSTFTKKLLHLKEVHRPAFYNCDICPCKFVSSTGLKNHRIAVHVEAFNNGQHSDYAVFQKKGSANELSPLKMDHVSSKNSNKFFENCHDFNLHARKHSFENITLDELKCVLCEKTYFSLKDLSDHLQSHDDSMVVVVGVHDVESHKGAYIIDENV